MNRILTLQVEIIDIDNAEWIWESIKEAIDYNGVIVKIIQEGPLAEKLQDDD